MKLTRIHQIEITSRCNLRCRYCVHPNMSRAKEDMSDDFFDRSIAVAIHLAQEAGLERQELNICGIGESTLHPRFLNFLETALRQSEVVFDVVLATNGIELSHDMAEEMARLSHHYPGSLSVWVSLHRPEVAAPAVESLKKFGILSGVSVDPAVASVNWAGQVKWPVSAQKGQCPWIKGGFGFVAANGDILTCCFDGEGVGKVGHISDHPSEIEVAPYSLCAHCHLSP